MIQRWLDWRFVVVLFVASATFITAVWIVHRWQRNTPSPQRASATTAVSK
ncbi:MAG: hypothetical protein ABFE01_29750 [Phycisphaerales bacterium]